MVQLSLLILWNCWQENRFIYLLLGKVVANRDDKKSADLHEEGSSNSLSLVYGKARPNGKILNPFLGR